MPALVEACSAWLHATERDAEGKPWRNHAEGDVTRLLASIESDDRVETEEILPFVYRELRALAAAKLARERPGQTLQATALVHEAYLRLMGNGPRQWCGRRHFFTAASEAMRRLLIENARRKNSVKRGGEYERVDWAEVRVAEDSSDERLLALNDALERLETVDSQAAALVKLRFFAGMPGPEAAAALDLSERTAGRLWSYARAWLLRELQASL